MTHVTSKNTKDAIYKAYQELREELSRVKASQKTRSTVQEESVPIGIIESLQTNQSSIDERFNQFRSALLSGVRDLFDRREESRKKELELSAVYDINDITESTLSDLVEQHQEIMGEFEQEIFQLSDAHKKSYEAKDASWELEAHQNEQDELRIKTADQQRLERLHGELEYQERMDRQRIQLQLNDLSTEQEEEINAIRSNRIMEMDKITRELETQVSAYRSLEEAVTVTFPGTLRIELDRAGKKGREKARDERKAELALLKAKIEGDYRLFDQEEGNMRNDLDAQRILIASLKDEYRNIGENIKQLALKGVADSVREEAMESIRNIAFEQAKNIKGSNK